MTSDLQEAADRMKIAAKERSLELAMRAVASLFRRYEGNELRDAAVQLVAELDLEVRSKSVLALLLLERHGVGPDEMLERLADRVCW
jgi:hypothetical protein